MKKLARYTVALLVVASLVGNLPLLVWQGSPSSVWLGNSISYDNHYRCTPELLTSDNRNSSITDDAQVGLLCGNGAANGCWIQNASDGDNDGVHAAGSSKATSSPTFVWQVSPQVQQACHLTTSRIAPLQSTPQDIQDTLQGKWILLIGDSSLRMLYDYLVGRWVGNYTHWPSYWENHGPLSHSVLCQNDMSCHYDIFIRGARVTFIWMNLVLRPDLKSVWHQTVGIPDMVVAQHGYWEVKMNTTEQAESNVEDLVRRITDVVDNEREMLSEYPQAYSNTRFGTSSSRTSNAAWVEEEVRTPKSERRPYKLWMSAFDKDFMRPWAEYRNNKNYSGSVYDGSNLAKSLGWNVLNRSYFGRDPSTNMPVNSHPMNEVLELELELFLLLIQRNL